MRGRRNAKLLAHLPEYQTVSMLKFGVNLILYEVTVMSLVISTIHDLLVGRSGSVHTESC